MKKKSLNTTPKMPLDIQLELTDFCNYNCIFCNSDPMINPHYDTRGFIDTSLVNNLLKELSNYSDNYSRITFQLNWAGEPSLHPQFLEIMTIFKKYSRINLVQKIELHTNCSNWNEHFIREFLKIINSFSNNPFFQITFSIDCLESTVYPLIRKGGNIEKVLKTLRSFYNLRENLDFKFPRFVYQFIPVTLNQKNLYTDIQELSKTMNCSKIICLPYERPFDTEKIVDVIYISPCTPINEERLDCWNKITGKLGLKNKSIEASLSQLNRSFNSCSHFFETPTISWKGDITVCASDEHFQLLLGSLDKNSFSDIWYGKTAMKYRENMKNGVYPEFCKKNCFYKSS